MIKSLKRGKGSRKLVNKRRKSLKRGKGSRQSVKKSKGFRKMYGGTPLTDFLIKTDNKKLTPDQEKELDEYLNDNSLINAQHREGRYYGYAPLHILCSQGTLNVPVVKKLIKVGADVNAKSIDNPYTPLDQLMLYDFGNGEKLYDTPFKKIMTLLLENGGTYDEKKIKNYPQKQEYIEYIKKTIQDKIQNETVNLLHKDFI